MVTCGHVLPLILVRQTPERVIEILLPSFNFIVGTLSPVTRPLIGLLNGVGRHHTDGPRPFEREKEVAREGVGGEPDFLADEHEERKLLESVVEFGDTLIREVMPPRPDIGAVKSSATLLELTDLFCEQLCVGEVNVEILEAERRRIQPVRMHRRLVIKEEPSDA